MKLLNEEEMSQWAYKECKKGNNTPEIRKLITNSAFAYWYCIYIESTEEMRSKLTEPFWVKRYREARKYINEIIR